MLTASTELTEIASDLVASVVREGPAGPVEFDLQQAMKEEVEAKVQAQIYVVLEGIGDAFYSLDEQWRFTYINRAAEAYFGIPRNLMLNQVIWDIIPESEGAEVRRR